MEICRACLSTGKDMIAMDSAFIKNYNLLTDLNINCSNKLPLYTCRTCFDAVKFCTEFREKCIASNLELMERLSLECEPKHEDQNSKIFEIKQEVKLEDMDSYYEDPFLDFDYSCSVTETKNEVAEWSPNKSITQVKKRVKKKPKEKKEQAKRKSECNDNTLLPCGICTKSFTNTESLVEHFNRHKLHKICGLCSNIFLDYTHLLAHRIVHLPEKQKTCHLCSQKFVSADYLEFHYIKKHNLKGEEGKFLCKECLIPIKSPRSLSKHVLAVHSNVSYICNECGKGFRVKQSLKNHINGHHNKNSFKCDLCNFTCNYYSGLNQHKIRRHVEGRVYCKQCSRLFASQEKLDQHNCRQKDANVLCPICGIHVKRLSRHMQTHSTEPSFHCDRCPAKFKTIQNYKAHKNKHDGNRTFHCEHCLMSFYSQSVLIKHRRTHTGEKPYVCKICGKGFTGNNNLKVHMRIHGLYVIVKKNTEIVDE